MTLNEKIKFYCQKNYLEIYDKVKKEITYTSKEFNNQKENDIEQLAQSVAIKNTFDQARKLFPDNIPTVWKAIYSAHLYRKSGIDDIEILQLAISASQSWKASSGHAFERFIKDIGSQSVAGFGIQFIMQKDLKRIIDENNLSNNTKDIQWLSGQIESDNFDLYTIFSEEINGLIKTYCFGCVQCKTSIRDRVSRDRELSKVAMEHFFWSIAFVLDATNLNIPKYLAMVNGGGQATFKENGWHAMYDISRLVNTGRIYRVDTNFSIVKSHAIQAKHAWKEERQWLDKNWEAL